MDRVLFATGDFGFGGAGKLIAVAERFGDCERLLAESENCRRLAPEALFQEFIPPAVSASTTELVRLRRELDLSLAVIVLNHAFAERCARAGIRTVLVDSLPFLWSANDAKFTEPDCYLAQMYPVLPRRCWSTLQRIPRLTWVGGIVAATRNSAVDVTRRHGQALVNLGGLTSRLMPRQQVRYPQLLLRPVLAALADHGFDDILICGNVDTIRNQRGASYRLLGHDDFRAAMASTELLVSSPGLTTLLEAAALGTPTILLPPQNLSQMYHLRCVRDLVAAPIAIDWPSGVVNDEGPELDADMTEDAAISAIYRGIAAAADSRRQRNAIATHLAEHMTTALKLRGDPTPMRTIASTFGVDGVDDVEAAVRAHLR